MPESSIASTRSFYETVADAYARAIPDAGHEPSIDRAMIHDFATRLPDQGDVRVLDAGCGTGRLTGHLSMLNPAVTPTGVDLSPAMLKHAKLAWPDHSFVEADLARLPFEDEHFHGVLAWYSIIHTAPQGLMALFTELRRVLRPGGLLLLAFHVGVGERVRPGAYGRDAELHAFLHQTSGVEAALVSAGMVSDTKLDRAPRGNERLPQGFVLARRPEMTTGLRRRGGGKADLTPCDSERFHAGRAERSAASAEHVARAPISAPWAQSAPSGLGPERRGQPIACHAVDPCPTVHQQADHLQAPADRRHSHPAAVPTDATHTPPQLSRSTARRPTAQPSRPAPRATHITTEQCEPCD